MTQTHRRPGQKTTKPVFFIFCEGETEKAYVKYLRSCYRLPVEVNTKVAGNRISAKYISDYKKQKVTHPKDKTFLIYDYDTESVVKRLQKIPSVQLIFSNPCFELWYLLHFINQTASLTSDQCLSKIASNIKKYQKGYLDEKLKLKLDRNKTKATARAKALHGPGNPSTLVYQLIEQLEKTAH
jgi:hypothetical protein